MIVEITSNKYVNYKIKEETIKNAMEFFKVHQDQWFKSEVLVRLLGYAHTRLLINRLRVLGEPIVSHTKYGYKYTTNKEELKLHYEKLRNRALTALTAARLMKKTLF